MEHIFSRLVQPIERKAIHKQIDLRIGPLSIPSKMPGYSWSIPASYCKMGGILRNVKGSACSKCYARKGRYAFFRVQSALERRLQAWLEDPDWVYLMAIRLLLYNKEYFRWFDSGDLQSRQMFEDINTVAALTPNIKHWLPTQERQIIKSYTGAISPNLVVRISNPMIDKPRALGYGCSSSVTTQKSLATCRSFETKGQCQDCRACWDPNVKHVIYFIH